MHPNPNPKGSGLLSPPRRLALAEPSEASLTPDCPPTLTLLGCHGFIFPQPQQPASHGAHPGGWEVLTHLRPPEFPQPCQVSSPQLPVLTPPWGGRRGFPCFSISDLTMRLHFWFLKNQACLDQVVQTHGGT